MSVRVISEGVTGRREERAEEGKRRKHFPGEVRPARPERCEREAREQGVVTRASMPVVGSKERSCFVGVFVSIDCEDGRKREMHLDQSRVDNEFNPVDSDTCFGDVSADDDFSSSRRWRFEHGHLRFCGKAGVERESFQGRGALW